MIEYRSRGFSCRSLPLELLAMFMLLLASVATAQADDAESTNPGPAATNESNTPAASGALQEVIVSAQRRAQSVQDVSISMVALTGEQLTQLGINNAQDLAADIPNVSFQSYYNAGKPQLSIRGYSVGDVFTDFEESPVGIYYDDVYMGSRSGQLMQMFDLDRVEVLEGPQGTLFGRNTSAGAIDFIAKKPGDQFEVDGSVTYGRFNEVDVDGGITIPVSDTLSIRLSGIQRLRDGWQYDINPAAPEHDLDNIDNWGSRLLVQFKPVAGMTWLLNVHGDGNNSNTPAIHTDLGQNGVCSPNVYTGYQVPCAWNLVASGQPTYEILSARGESLTGTIEFGGMTLTSISANEYVAYHESEDDGDEPIDIATFNIRDVVSQYSQELRLAAKEGPFDWVTGLYYYTDYLTQALLTTSFDDPFFTDTFLAPSAENAQNYPTQASHNEAVFGDLRYALASQWTLDLGARYTYETKHIHSDAFLEFPNPPYGPLGIMGFYQTIGGAGEPDSNLKNTWSAPTGRVALEWKPTADMLAYGSWSRGFKSGGYNGLAVNSVAELTPYSPETDDTYELGLKTQWLEGRLTANGAIFYNQIKNLQALYVETPPPAYIPYFYVVNAASGTSKGAEFQVHARPGGGWNISAGLGLLNTRYNRFVLPDGSNFTGEEFLNAPRQTGNLMVQYTFRLFSGTLGPDVDYSYRSFMWTDNPHRPGIDDIPGYGLLNTNIPWTSSNGRWELSIWGRNLTNKHYFLQTIGNGALDYGAADSYHADPITYGVRVGYKFE